MHLSAELARLARWQVLSVVVVVALLVLPAAASGHPQSSKRNPLTAYGATRKAWNAHHVGDPNPKLSKGCCFLPRQRDGYDRYYEVMYDGGRVISYGMHFTPRISASSARLLMRQELPQDARLVRRVRRHTCEQLLYRSATLKSTLGSGSVGVEFSATGAGGPYRGTVGDMIIEGFDLTSVDC